jgi:hypothetical protein
VCVPEQDPVVPEPASSLLVETAAVRFFLASSLFRPHARICVHLATSPFPFPSRNPQWHPSPYRFHLRTRPIRLLKGAKGLKIKSRSASSTVVSNITNI